MFPKIVKKELGLTVEKEYMFHPTRKWRIDYAIPEYKIAIEVEGGVWSKGRHIQPKGFLADIEKYNQLSIIGWRLLRVTPDTIYSVKTLEMIKESIKWQISIEN
jgi:very-short-patch-repair endonuclease